MSKSLKKLFSVFLSFVLTATLLSAGAVAFGEDLVAINSTNFSDPVFRKVLLTKEIDTNQDGVLNAQERGVDELQISGLLDKYYPNEQISSLDGIEHFTELKILRCGDIGLESLDVSSLINLSILTCQGNYLTSLDLSANYYLTAVQCDANELTELLLPVSSTFQTLQCQNNYLTSLELIDVPNIVSLRCDHNEFSSIDFSSATKLSFLNCKGNHLASIDLSKTQLSGITEYYLGGQEITLRAEIQGDNIVIPFDGYGINTVNYMGSTLEDYGTGAGFDYDRFNVTSVDEIKDGFTYYCSPMLDTAENMSVDVTVERDFFEVKFYNDSALTELLSKSYVSEHQAAVEPEITAIPQCKAFDRWSESVDDITSDMSVYVVWKDSHGYVPYSIASDNDTVTVKCNDCGSSYTVSFISLVNKKDGDAVFDKNIDVIKDGYINAKDYAKLLKMVR